MSRFLQALVVFYTWVSLPRISSGLFHALLSLAESFGWRHWHGGVQLVYPHLGSYEL